MNIELEDMIIPIASVRTITFSDRLLFSNMANSVSGTLIHLSDVGVTLTVLTEFMPLPGGGPTAARTWIILQMTSDHRSSGELSRFSLPRRTLSSGREPLIQKSCVPKTINQRCSRRTKICLGSGSTDVVGWVLLCESLRCCIALSSSPDLF